MIGRSIVTHQRLYILAIVRDVNDNANELYGGPTVTDGRFLRG